VATHAELLEVTMHCQLLVFTWPILEKSLLPFFQMLKGKLKIRQIEIRQLANRHVINNRV
jgi:hypothetical protein